MSEEVEFLANNMRKAMRMAYCMDYYEFADVMHNSGGEPDTTAKWEMMQKDFAKWFCYLDHRQAERFCAWVLEERV